MGWLQFSLRDFFYWVVIAAQATAIYLLNRELDAARQAAQDLVVPAAVRPGEQLPGWERQPDPGNIDHPAPPQNRPR